MTRTAASQNGSTARPFDTDVLILGAGPVDEGRRIAGLIPGARLAVMDNCGHWPQYEDTETFNKIHLDFLLGRTTEES